VKQIPLVLLLVTLVLTPAGVSAHEIPSDVKIQAFLRPDGQRLMLLVRGPVASTVNDLEWPMRGLLLDLARVDQPLLDAAGKWFASRVDLYGNGRQLGSPRVAAVRISLPSDTSFDSYDRALAHVTGAPLAADIDLVAGQALIDVLLEYPLASPDPQIAIATRFETAALRSVTVLRFQMPGTSKGRAGPNGVEVANSVERVFQFHGDSGFVTLDPRWFQAASRFVADGFFHILGGVDHLLFLLCLVIPFRRLGSLAIIVTSFTVAHSVTLIASAYDMAPSAAWFPPLVETLIAASIVYMALENIVSPALNRRWVVTFGFGLIHGFGFSFALRESLQLAGNHVFTSLVSFNIGVEIGQLLVLVIAVPLLDLLFRFGLRERIGTIVISAFVAHTGWHWLTERGSQLMQYRFEWPAFDLVFLDLLLRWLMLAVGLAAVAWLIFGVLAKRLRSRQEQPSPYSEGSVL
jgi:hypothetical protein